MTIPTVHPMRTFLEKIFLLHEEFMKPAEKIRYTRLSRHLYDLEKMMDTEHARAALQNPALYQAIVQHRMKFNAIRGLDYSRHSPALISFVPPEAVRHHWEADYRAMRQSMIYGNAPEFDQLIRRLLELQERLRSLLFFPFTLSGAHPATHCFHFTLKNPSTKCRLY